MLLMLARATGLEPATTGSTVANPDPLIPPQTVLWKEVMAMPGQPQATVTPYILSPFHKDSNPFLTGFLTSR